jgi:hypothetical protein
MVTPSSDSRVRLSGPASQKRPAPSSSDAGLVPSIVPEKSKNKNKKQKSISSSNKAKETKKKTNTKNSKAASAAFELYYSII